MEHNDRAYLMKRLREETGSGLMDVKIALDKRMDQYLFAKEEKG
jgi:translation elongation factor EF-Ts